MADQPKANHPDERGFLRRVCACPVPDDATTNASYALGYTGDNLTTIDKTMNSVVYRKTLAYTGARLDSITVWVEQ